MNGASPTPPERPPVVRRVDTAGASELVNLVETFEDLQMVLRCCERLVDELADDGSPCDDVVIEAVWTLALLSYARCFAMRGGGAVLTTDDVTAAQPGGDAVEWHRVLLELRGHYADPVANPRERFSVGVSQEPDGEVSGIAITSVRQPLVDDPTVRQTGAIAYALSSLVNERIEARQHALWDHLKDTPKADLETFARLDIAEPAAGT